MGRRLLSHLLISLAIFSLTATFFIWVIDMTVLNPAHLSKALRDGGVPSAIASILPDKAVEGEVGSGNQPAPETVQEKQDKAEMKAKIASVVTPAYVDQKIQVITTSVITYMKNGSPPPIIDISDFPAKLRASGVDVGNDIDKNFSKPVELNNNGSLNVLPKAYKIFSLAKYLGIVLFVLLLLSEWFVTPSGDRLHRIGRIFLHAGIWYTLYWVSLIVIPSYLLPSFKDKIKADVTIGPLIDAVTKSVQHLFSVYFLGFAIVCWVIALALYLIRHARKHISKIDSIPGAKASLKKPVPNKR